MSKSTLPFDVRSSAFGVRCLLLIPSLDVGRWALDVGRCLCRVRHSAFGVQRFFS
jgi:hypothetical protein